MKQERRRKFCFLLSSVILISGTMGPAKAADPFSDKGNTEKVVDAYITVMTMAYPPAGGALAAAKGMMSMLGFFSKPDAVGEAIKSINARLDVIDKRIDTLEAKLTETRNEVFRNANLQNTRELRRHRDTIAQVLLALQNKPTDKYGKEKVVLDAKQVCNAILEDRKLWVWSDLALKDHTWNGKKIKKGEMIDPDFKPMPTLEVYATALATWMAAMEYAGGGNANYVKTTFGADLQRHIDYLSVRSNWNELNGTPQTLPEQIQARVIGYYVPTSRTAGPDRVATIAEYTRDDMGREIKLVGNINYTTKSANELVNVPAGLLNRSTPKEDELEGNYGLDVMKLLAEKLKRLRDKGTLREQFIGTFNPTYSYSAYLYHTTPDGNLWWQMDTIGTAPSNPPRLGALQVSHNLTDAKQVGNGWSGLADILPGGASTFYTLHKNGDLFWFRHDGYANGGNVSTWKGPVKVGNGWNDALQIIPMGDGVLYSIMPDGTLRWNRHNNFKTGQGGYGGWAQPYLEVSRKWAQYKAVFGGGNGVFYVVTKDGRLFWYRHDYLHPIARPSLADSSPANMKRRVAWANTWKGPKEIGTGWGDLTKIFCAGNGKIYGILPDGTLRGYLHTGWEDGAATWGTQVDMGGGWDKYPYVFVSMPSRAREDDIVVR
ncbi:hypothetical protein EON83_20045 [bacterium]|nr:MAG: hypothetical protein EON83_20045 [bacterium]